MPDNVSQADHLSAAHHIEASREPLLSRWIELVADRIDGAEEVGEPALRVLRCGPNDSERCVISGSVSRAEHG
jgi:hypothetical protein